jgi:hypothetical protein
VTVRLTVSTADQSNRVRVHRLGTMFPGETGTGLLLWPHRWDDGLIVVGPDRLPTPRPVPPLPCQVGRITLPDAYARHLIAADQRLLLVCDGRELWLANAGYVLRLLQSSSERRS